MGLGLANMHLAPSYLGGCSLLSHGNGDPPFPTMKQKMREKTLLTFVTFIIRPS